MEYHSRFKPIRIQSRPFLLTLDLNLNYGALPPLQEDGVSATGLLYPFGIPHLFFSSSSARQTVIDSSLLFYLYLIGGFPHHYFSMRWELS